MNENQPQIGQPTQLDPDINERLAKFNEGLTKLCKDTELGISVAINVSPDGRLVGMPTATSTRPPKEA